MTSIAISIPITSPSTIRRKPKLTYRSPTATSHADAYGFTPMATSATEAKLIITQLQPRSLSISSSLQSAFKSPSSRNASPSPSPTTPGSAVSGQAAPPKRKYPMAPPLPLYHPLGPLALSLPPLDPTEFGLPAPPIRVDDDARRSSARARRPAAKLRDAEEEPPSPAGTVRTANSGSAREANAKETKEPPKSPRKRRAAGGAAGGAKRRRREPEDSDTTYPAQRTRRPRGQAAAAAAAASSAETASPPGSVAGDASTPKMDTAIDLPSEEPVPERRTTRARNALNRRGSSASETTTVSVTAPSVSDANLANIEAPATPVPTKEDTDVVMAVDSPAVSAAPSSEPPKPVVELEEGEVPEDPVTSS
ncbi:hypothetical protein HGRIS_002256 [Hohenbuehelia grisea]|uniref:Uncharacterized protein n=1 Tax=Hohenbuehelia grisea TaxID=104357 RepID=A0ABR3JJZ5_9AGAR